MRRHEDADAAEDDGAGDGEAEGHARTAKRLHAKVLFDNRCAEKEQCTAGTESVDKTRLDLLQRENEHLRQRVSMLESSLVADVVQIKQLLMTHHEIIMNSPLFQPLHRPPLSSTTHSNAGVHDDNKQLSSAMVMANKDKDKDKDKDKEMTNELVLPESLVMEHEEWEVIDQFLNNSSVSHAAGDLSSESFPSMIAEEPSETSKSVDSEGAQERACVSPVDGTPHEASRPKRAPQRLESQTEQSNIPFPLDVQECGSSEDSYASCASDVVDIGILSLRVQPDF
eukprot:ANDGO_04289.mRNA.1 hypothetical protein